MRRSFCFAVLSIVLVARPASAQSLWPTLQPLYEDLHAHPELSFQETATAAKMAAQLKALGFEVTTGVGRTGVVGVLKNGAGPTVMLRTELDALPVEEKTGLAYASKATGTNPAGLTVPVMHACGHDVHMTVWVGAATTLARDKKSWRGTLIMVGQPAEEIGGGAEAMLADGLFTRFPKPDFALAIHDNDSLAAGVVGIKGGPLLASADSVDIVVHGKGGHGARPHKTIDPVVIAAKIVLGLQTLVSRENDPFDPAVVTVGSIHGGTKHNIIPDEVRMQLTVRAYKPEVRERLMRGIERIAKAEGEAANVTQPPEVTFSDHSPVTVNDTALAARVGSALKKSMGEARVTEAIPIMGAEDFSQFAEAGVPILMMWVGAVNPEVLDRAKREGTVLPSLHSSSFAPDPQPTIMTGLDALAGAAREVLGKGR
jgi:hippurate hydrolase